MTRAQIARRYFRWRRRRLLEGVAMDPSLFDHLVIFVSGLSPWSRSLVTPEVVEHMMRCEGVTEACIRDAMRSWDRDVLIVRCWNWRKFEISGLHEVQCHQGARRHS